MFCAGLHSEPGEVIGQAWFNLSQFRGKLDDGFLHGKNASTASNVEHDLVFEQVLVLDNGVHVGSSSNFIFLLQAKILVPALAPTCCKKMKKKS